MLITDRNRSDEARDKTPALRKILRAFGSAGLLVIAFTPNMMADAFEVEESVATASGEIEDTTIVIKRLPDGQHWIANPNRAQLRFSPASTSKIPHSLIALENRLASSGTIFEWDGVPRSNRTWNQDHTIETAFQYSAVWVYQRIAQTAGQSVMSDGLKSFGYGNADVGTVDQLTTYWLDGTLTISAQEQVEFLSELALEHLPLTAATYAAAKEIMVSDARSNWTMRSKTGWWYSETEMDIGWFVGWLECASETYVFALNMDMPDTTYLSKRKAVTYGVLQDIGAFDCD